jgi:hypothetical protein
VSDATKENQEKFGLRNLKFIEAMKVCKYEHCTVWTKTVYDIPEINKENMLSLENETINPIDFEILYDTFENISESRHPTIEYEDENGNPINIPNE